MENKIDFVILWVDGSDQEWKKERSKYIAGKASDTSEARYRDWDNLRYWFRSVEKNAPWVNRIFFVTCGHIPDWLNTDNPKIKVVKHSDYIDKKYLPLFNSSAIEIGIDKIPALSEKFILFNDDMFIIDKVKQSDFFKKNTPRDSFSESPVIPNGENPIFTRILINNAELANKVADKKNFIKKHPLLYINPRYGIRNIVTLLSMPHKSFVGFYNPHIPQAFLKSSFTEFFDRFPEKLQETQSNRFRNQTDTTQYAVRYYQMLLGNFAPRSFRFGRYFTVTENNSSKVSKYILKKKRKVICINDTDACSDFEIIKEEINDSFERMYPNKSEYEK